MGAMIARTSIAWALVVVSLSWVAVARAQGSRPTADDGVAVLPLELVGNVPAGRTALETAVVRGLTMFTGTTVDATQSSARLIAGGAKLPCEDASCWATAGKAVGARHLVAGRVERRGENFEVQFRLFDGPSGRLLATETNKCEASDCSVAELTRQTVRELARTMLSGSAGGSATGPGPVPSAGASDAPAAASSSAPPAALAITHAPADRGPGGARRALPYALAAGGVAALAAGGVVMWLDGSCQEHAGNNPKDNCNTYRETMWEGVAATSVGAALLATGAVLLIIDRRDAGDHTTVAVGPGSLLLRGRF
jgi:hypothetical protein